MQDYRSTPAPIPLLSLVAGRLLAIDAASGLLRWEKPVVDTLDRVLVAGSNVFFVTCKNQQDGHLTLFDLATGNERGASELGFRVTAALATADRVYLSGLGGLVCLTHDGAVVFRVARQVTQKSAWAGDTFDLVGIDAQNRELWRVPDAKAITTLSFLALGHLVAQVDFDT
jgi:outer membrane protein assembly factor BamB